MNKNDNSLLKYFFIIGIKDEICQEIIDNKLKTLPEKTSPQILSSYSLEGDTSLFTLIKNSLNENEDLKNNIFPMKSDYLEYIIREDYDEKQKISIKKVFDDYLIHSKKK